MRMRRLIPLLLLIVLPGLTPVLGWGSRAELDKAQELID
jgi:hypothetical protein